MNAAATENCPVPRHVSPVHICHRQGSLKGLILNSSSNEWKHLVNHVADSAAWRRNRADRPLPCHGWPAAIIMIINGGFSTDLARSSPFLLPLFRMDGRTGTNNVAQKGRIDERDKKPRDVMRVDGEEESEGPRNRCEAYCSTKTVCMFIWLSRTQAESSRRSSLDLKNWSW